MKVRVSENRMDRCVLIKMLCFCHVFYLQERREYWLELLAIVMNRQDALP